MPTATVNGVRLYYTLSGDAGPPLALIHGSWGDHTLWDPLIPALAERFRVLAYDRRGHSQSERPAGQGSAAEDADDLAALLAHLGFSSAHIAGVSFGGTVALWLAARHPAMVRGLMVHEPPLFDLVVDDPIHGAETRAVLKQVAAVAGCLDHGKIEAGTRQFVEAVAFGPGAWEQLPPEVRSVFIGNAATFLDEVRDPTCLTVDLATLAGFRRPVLLTHGDQSPPCFLPVVTRLASSLPRAEIRPIAGAGHVPVRTHPAEFAAAIMDFTEAADAAGSGRGDPDSGIDRQPDPLGSPMLGRGLGRRTALHLLGGSSLAAALALAGCHQVVAKEAPQAKRTVRQRTETRQAPPREAIAPKEESAVSYFDLEPDVRLHYEEQGEGRPVIFLPGWTGSTRVFRDQLSLFAEQHRAIALDYRAHGQSTRTLTGHSLAGYARDLRAFLLGRNLERAVLAGWSMGAFVVWEYLQQFGNDRLAGFVNIDQPPCDSQRPDWPHGFDLLEACRFATSVQEDQAGTARQLLDLIFKSPPAESDAAWMLAEMLRVPAPVAGVMFIDDMVYDARPVLPEVTLPTLLCSGRHSAVTPLAAGEFIARTQPNARLVVFEESGHSPFLEEPARFHDEVTRFIAGLS